MVALETIYLGKIGPTSLLNYSLFRVVTTEQTKFYCKIIWVIFADR